MRRRSITLICLATAALLGVIGCGGNDADEPTIHAVDVVACGGQTMTGEPPSKPAETMDALLTDAVAEQVSFYSFAETAILAPKGWRCEGASGSGGANVKAHDPDAGFHSNGSGGGFQPEEALSAYIATRGSNHPLYLACGSFPDAAAELEQQGLSCDAPATAPTGEAQTRAGIDELRFTDPPGVVGTGNPSGGRNPARGFVIWVAPTESADGANAAATATCVLPPESQSLCTAILNDFRARFSQTG